MGMDCPHIEKPSSVEKPKEFLLEEIMDPSLKMSKRNICFIFFAGFVLQITDTILNWMAGDFKNSDNFTQEGGDTFLIPAGLLCILIWAYSNWFEQRKNSNEEEAEKELPEQTIQTRRKISRSPEREIPKTMVEDMQERSNAKWWREIPKCPPGPQQGRRTSKSPEPAKQFTMSASAKEFIMSTLNPSAPEFMMSGLNAKARKFVPCFLDSTRSSVLHSNAPAFHSSVLHSDAPAFIPVAHVLKEKKLLETESGENDAGDVLYRSTHWVNEIGSDKTRLSLHSDAPAFVPEAQALKEKKLLETQSGDNDAGDVLYRSTHWVNEIASAPEPEKRWVKKQMPSR